MRASDAMPGEPWPRDMSISISGDQLLEELLYARSALALGDNGVPPIFPIPDAGSSRRPEGFDLAASNLRWREEWGAAWERIQPFQRRVRRPTAGMQRVLETTADDPGRSGPLPACV